MKKYFIIGGTSGIGYEIVKYLLKNKNKVCFTYYKNSTLAKQIVKSSPFVKAFKLDLQSEININQAIKNSKKYLSKFDIVILCSLKYLKRKNFNKIKTNDIESFYKYNFFGYLKILKYLLKIQKKKLTIINLSTYALKNHSSGLSFYNSYKAAMEEFFLTLSNEYNHIKFKNVRLGKYDTKGFRKTNLSYLKKSSAKIKHPNLAIKKVLKGI